MFENQKKSHLTLRAKRATFTFKVDKSSLKMPKSVYFGNFGGQTVLPDRGLKKNAKIEKSKMRHFE